ncbi:MAG: LPS export ABC transporter ATP-binding protein [Deltaproteobacteria bacterium]|nr:LPS export ABC transporter ATP-binding protein [Deltaproteobacteria bacterium]MCL5277060.1 LPS export ABC transporter ATP-binding protein [Deltaproteobacteria bacterium]
MDYRLEAVGLKKSFGKKTVVSDVSFSVKSGEIIGLLGPNGAGKSTTFYMIVGIYRPDKGKIILNDEDITGNQMFVRARKGITYLPQEPSVFRKLSVEDNIKVVFESMDLGNDVIREKTEEIMKSMNIVPLRKSMGYSLSGGERRRVEISRALAANPHFMLLDEPFAGIDPIAVNELREILFSMRGKGLGIIISDHNVRETLNVCDKAYIINNGRIIEEGEPKQIAMSENAKRIYLGEDFKL